MTLNIVVQWVVAWPIEVEQGGVRTIGVHLAGGFMGALGACVLQPQPMLGASAGIYAVLISHLAHLYLVSVTSVKELIIFLWFYEGGTLIVPIWLWL